MRLQQDCRPLRAGPAQCFGQKVIWHWTGAERTAAAVACGRGLQQRAPSAPGLPSDLVDQSNLNSNSTSTGQIAIVLVDRDLTSYLTNSSACFWDGAAVIPLDSGRLAARPGPLFDLLFDPFFDQFFDQLVV